jgi:hypothetical protein
MTPFENLKEILDKDYGGRWEGDNALNGLTIIAKYFHNKTVLQGADHDIIYSVSAEEILDAGLTMQDAEALAYNNWMVDSDSGCLACYV